MSSNTQMWAPVRHGSVSSLIVDRILEVIDSERLRPGDRLPPERELAGLLGTSRPTLREALQTLKAQGRVEIRHGAGVFVADPATTQSLRAALKSEELSLTELFDMREVLEVPAAGWAASHQDTALLAKVKDAYDRLMEASRDPEIDWKRVQQLDADFHMRIVEAAGNRFLTRSLGVLQGMLAQGMETTLQVPGRMEKSRADHERILKALLEGDAATARRAANSHIRGARTAALNRVREQQAR